MLKACLIGEKLGHSLSPVIHKRFYKTAGKEGSYTLCETPKAGLKDLLDKLKSENFSGANVTIPYKTEVMQYLDGISDEAKAIGAVNTIYFSNGKMYGYNTDYFGLKTLIEASSIEISQKNVVILGTGGASKCAYKLSQDMGAEKIIVVSRTEKPNSMIYKELGGLKSIDVLINTTPSGMYPDVYGCPVGDEIISKCGSVVDVVYNPMKTQLVRKALAIGKKAAGGLMMLTAQAIKAQEIWNDTPYKTDIYNDVYDYVKGLKTNLVIIGMPGSGKSSIGQMTAERLGMSFIDTDDLVEKKHGSIPDIFEKQGEAVFRGYESEAADLASDIRGVVTATGGGIVLNKKNIDVLKKSGIVFFIDRPLSVLLEKTDGAYRPLISDDNSRIKGLYEKRYPLYRKYADHIVKNDKSIHECIDEIIKLWGNVR